VKEKKNRLEEREIPPSSTDVIAYIPSRMVIVFSELFFRKELKRKKRENQFELLHQKKSWGYLYQNVAKLT
jgi:hypothetical protein